MKLTPKQKDVLKQWRLKKYGSTALRAYLEVDYILIERFSTLSALVKKGICEYSCDTPKYKAPLYTLTELGKTIEL